MAIPYATSTLVRYLTDKMLDSVAKQLQQRAPGVAIDDAPAQLASPALIEIIGHMNASLIKLDEDLQALTTRVNAIDARVTRMEGRWGMWALIRVALIVALAFVVGFGLAWLLHLGGWY